MRRNATWNVVAGTACIFLAITGCKKHNAAEPEQGTHILPATIVDYGSKIVLDSFVYKNDLVQQVYLNNHSIEGYSIFSVMGGITFRNSPYHLAP